MLLAFGVPKLLTAPWADVAWQAAPSWTLAGRAERLVPSHHLEGVGTTLLAREAGLPIIGPHEGDRFWIESLDDTDGIATWEHGDYFPQVYRDYRATGAVRVGPVGRCEAELFDAEPFVRFSVDWLNRHLGRDPHR